MRLGCDFCRSPRISPSAVSISPSESSVLDQAEPPREEDSDLFASATPVKRSPGSATSSAAASTPASVSAPAAQAAAPASDQDKPAASAAPTNDSSAARSQPASTSGLHPAMTRTQCVSCLSELNCGLSSLSLFCGLVWTQLSNMCAQSSFESSLWDLHVISWMIRLSIRFLGHHSLAWQWRLFRVLFTI